MVDNKIYDYDENPLDLTVFKKEYDEIQEKQKRLVYYREGKNYVNSLNSVSRSNWLWKLREKAKKNTSSFLSTNRNDSALYKNFDKTSRPPCNLYKPQFNIKFR